MLATPEVTIRKIEAVTTLQDGDLSAMARISTAIDPDLPTSADELRTVISEHEPLRVAHGWLIADDARTGEAVGYAWYHQIPWSFHPGKYRIRGGVHPDWQRRGIGHRLMIEILTILRAAEAQRIKVRVREDRARAIAFVQRFGFAEHARSFESSLAAAACDLSRFTDYTERIAPYGIVLTN
ncbi:MAG: GNAT family N-acetyltransferase, partial [Vicinamibacterales bacterium]